MQNQLVDLYRNGIKTAADVTRQSLENTVRLQEKQLGIVRSILEESKSAAERLGEANSIEQLFAWQTRLWSSLWQAAAENQRAWIEQVQSGIGQTQERAREAQVAAVRTSEEVARAAANQVSRAAGSPRESGSAAQRKSA
jgi:hypothetical protein